MTVTSPEPSSLQSPRRHHSWNITPCSAIWKTCFIMNIIILIIFVIFKFIMHVWIVIIWISRYQFPTYALRTTLAHLWNIRSYPELLCQWATALIAYFYRSLISIRNSQSTDRAMDHESHVWSFLTAVHHAAKRMTSFIFEGVITKSVSIRSMFSLVKAMRLKCVILKRW